METLWSVKLAKDRSLPKALILNSQEISPTFTSGLQPLGLGENRVESAGLHLRRKEMLKKEKEGEEKEEEEEDKEQDKEEEEEKEKEKEEKKKEKEEKEKEEEKEKVEYF